VTKVTIVGADTDPTNIIIIEDKVVPSVVSELNSIDPTPETNDNDSEGHIRFWSPSFQNHRIEEPVMYPVLDQLEDMEVVVDDLELISKLMISPWWNRKDSPDWK
jgi:hypothetical protein